MYRGAFILRVIAGTKRGLKLFEFEGADVRPTTDRVKENIFNIIFPHISDASVLDVFAGSGALTVEALSRGAKDACLTDLRKESLDLAKKNVSHAGFSDKCAFFQTDGIDFILNTDRKFDIIFLDPPYNTGLAKKALEAIGKSRVLSEDGIVVLERDSEEVFEISSLKLIKDKKYGRTCVCVYTY